MSEVAVAGLVCLCVLAGAALGAALRPVLPEHHMSEPSRQIVNIAIGLIATLAALVLGLLVASAKSSFEQRSDEIKQSATRLVLLDRSLRQYGPETKEIRDLLRRLTERRIALSWNPGEENHLKEEVDASSSEIIREKLWQLKPQTDAQRWLHARAIGLTADIEQARWMLVEASQSSIPRPFLIVLAFWLAAIFAALGLFAPRNATVYVVLFVCALSVSTAILMIFEMDQPFEGVLQVSDAPLRGAVEEMMRAK